MMKKVLPILAAFLISGCAASSVNKAEGTKIDRDSVLSLKPGETTRQAVLDAFGTPGETSVENNEEKIIYVYREKKTPTYLGGVVESEAQSIKTETTLEVVLKDGIVRSYRFKREEK